MTTLEPWDDVAHRVEHRQIAADLHELADVVMGTPRTDLEGGGRNPDGLTHKVDTILNGQRRVERLVNGGRQFRKRGKGEMMAIAGMLGAAVASAVKIWVG